MSASINNEERENNLDGSINYDEIEELISNQDENSDEINTESKITINSIRTSNERPVSQHHRSSACITQVQNISLSLEKSLVNVEENSGNETISNKSNISLSNVKTSNIPGPVGLLPILKTNEDLRRLKEDKTARDTLLTNEENINVKRPKTSSDLFSLNIHNYPSYGIALRQLKESFSCEPINIHTALVKARLGIKKKIPLMCAAVTHYDRQENTILLDKSAHIRATFIGDDEVLDNFNIRVGHTLVLRNVAVFTSTRHRHHYVNIHLQNIIAIQDPLNDSFSMPLVSEQSQQQNMAKSILHAIENEISAYGDSSKTNNETFHIFSQFDNDDDDNEQPPVKKMVTNSKSSNNAAFNRIKTSVATSSGNKFKETIVEKPQPTFKPSIQVQKPSTSTLNKHVPTVVTITPPSSMAEADLIQMIEKPIDIDINSEDFANDEFFSICLFHSSGTASLETISSTTVTTTTTTTISASTTTTTSTTSLTAYGPQVNFDPTALSSAWSLCYSAAHATPIYVNISAILTICNKNKLLLDCRPIGNVILTLAVMGDRTDVLYDCCASASLSRVANGVGWYYSTTLSSAS
ncbi:unnamed protein product [Rotaria socialis]|uniref:Homologous recombination OB-fold protein OB-fold domain-containing protein n=2 Tax=Rotaria socialis TaxID=392032 RepID=A0A819WWI0_9BILA|nr:unnamed protein product [Rotaria socialis]